MGDERKYSYAELKEAQRRCTEKAIAAALKVQPNMSAAQKDVARAHVNDVVANVFSNAIRHYDPTDQGDMEEVDQELASKVAEEDKRIKEIEASIKEKREKVFDLVKEHTKLKMENQRKEASDVTFTQPDLEQGVYTDPAEIETIKRVYENSEAELQKTVENISQAVEESTSTIASVGRNAKRHRSAVDDAMEQSPPRRKLMSKRMRESNGQRTPLRSRLMLRRSDDSD